MGADELANQCGATRIMRSNKNPARMGEAFCGDWKDV